MEESPDVGLLYEAHDLLNIFAPSFKTLVHLLAIGLDDPLIAVPSGLRRKRYDVHYTAVLHGEGHDVSAISEIVRRVDCSLVSNGFDSLRHGYQTAVAILPTKNWIGSQIAFALKHSPASCF